ncbi:MAG TPA: hypothetical protein VF731_05645 [Solirubrobacterales bacterium]
MELMRQSWTDDRLDDFRTEVNRRFDEVYRRFDEVKRRFGEVDQRFNGVEAELRDVRIEMRAGFDRMDERFDRMYRLMLQLGGGAIAALVGLIATQL